MQQSTAGKRALKKFDGMELKTKKEGDNGARVEAITWESTRPACFSGTQRSAVSYDSLLSRHLENIQRPVDASSPSMPSTDLIGTQDRQPNREINSLSVSD